MSGSVHIVKRTVQSGKRYVVRYRLGGRAFKLRHGGSFTREKDAKLRRDFIAGELAAGRDPGVALKALRDKPATVTVSQWGERFVKSRVDVSAKTQKNYAQSRARVDEMFGDRDPRTITPAECGEWIAENDDLAPSTLRNYFSTFAQILDHADVEPNPCRSSKVKLPPTIKAEHQILTFGEFEQIIAAIPARYRLPLEIIECCALRVGELAQLTWGDIDWTRSRIRVSKQRTKGKSGGQRFILLPAELLARVSDLLPPDDRVSSRRIFRDITADGLQRAMRRACVKAGIPEYSPHDLRHRRSSLWGAQGTPQALWSRRMGHSQVSTTQDEYSHVVAPNDDLWADFWASAVENAE